MEKSSGSTPKVISNLSHPELLIQKQQIDEDIGLLHKSILQLKMAQTKFLESKKSIENTEKYSIGQPLLVPLTGSMYVDGKIADKNSFIINVGTGYYLKKDAEGAKEYFQRRLTYVTTQIEKLQALGNDRNRIKDVLKLQELHVAQQQASSNAAAKKA